MAKCPTCNRSIKTKLSPLRVTPELDGWAENIERGYCKSCKRYTTILPKLARMMDALLVEWARSPREVTPAEIDAVLGQLNWTRSELARRLGVDRSLVSRWFAPKDAREVALSSQLQIKAIVLLHFGAKAIEGAVSAVPGDRTPICVRFAGTKWLTGNIPAEAIRLADASVRRASGHVS